MAEGVAYGDLSLDAYAALVEDCERVDDEAAVVKSCSAGFAVEVASGCRKRTCLGSFGECVMPYIVDFNAVSTVGLESSPVAAALAGLRANEARYFKNKYDHVFTVEPASKAKATMTGCTGSSRKNATSSSRLALSRLLRSRSRTSEWPTSSTRAVSRST